jgi:hypothetical protein
LDSLADQVESLNDEILTRHQDVARIVDNLQHELAEARESQKYWQGLWEKAANGVLGLQED